MDKTYKFQKSQSEQIWTTIKEFRGAAYIDIRTYYSADGAKWLPTKKGVSIPTAFMDEVKSAVEFVDGELHRMMVEGE